MKTVVIFSCVALMLVSESGAQRELSNREFLEKVIHLVSSSMNVHSPPHGLLYWSLNNRPSGSPSTSTAPEGYEHHAGLGYYKLYDYAAPWHLAKEVCDVDGAHLLVLNSEAETAMAKKLMAKFPVIRGTPKDHDALWIGLFEKGVNGQFYTIHGQPLSATGFNRWEPPHPNKPGLSDCGAITRKTGGLADGLCHVERGFICEYVD